MDRTIRLECTCGTWDSCHEPQCDRTLGYRAAEIGEAVDDDLDADDWEPTPHDYADAGLNAA